MAVNKELYYLGDTLRALRKSKGLTLEQLASKSEAHVGTLSKIERHQLQPSLDMLYRIVQALGISLGDLFQTPASIATADSPLGEQQAALNAAFMTMAEDDRALLLEFAELLKVRRKTPSVDDEEGAASDSLTSD